MKDNPVTPDAAIHDSAQRIRQALGQRALPRVAVLLGSGWGPFADVITDAVDLPYSDLPAFPALASGAGVSGHAGLLRVGRVAGQQGDVPVAVLAGRKHSYETGAVDAMKGAIRTLHALGVTTLVQTNAAGSLHPRMAPGSLMLVTDHLNLVQRSPLVGESGNQRFVDMNAAYCPLLAAQARAAAASLGAPLHEGVYAWVLGPQFETPAEIRMLHTLGAQAVGMSTVPETILARHAGLRVLALSLITNMAAGLSAEVLSHAHTLANAQASAAQAVALLTATLNRITQEHV
jgi:purine-nucleoside phosphorylase